MKTKIALAAAALCFGLAAAGGSEAFAARNCPAGIFINSVSQGSNALQGATPHFEKVFMEILKSRFGARANVTSVSSFNDATRREKERFDKIKEKCDAFLDTSGTMPPECDMGPDTQREFSAIGDFAVTISAHELGPRLVVTLRAVQAAGSGSSVLATASLNFTTDQAADSDAFGSLLEGQVRPIAQRFAGEFEKRFYCVELDPKHKKVEWKGEPITIPYTAKAENLAGKPAGGDVKASYWNEMASWASIDPTDPRFSGGKAPTTYTMHKRTHRDTVHLDVFPPDGITTGTTAAVEVEREDLCLSINGFHDVIIDAGEGGHGEARWNVSLPPTPVPADDNLQIFAEGTLHMSASTVITAEDASGSGAKEQDDSLTIRGFVDNNNIAHFKVKGSGKISYPVTIRAEGEAVSVPYNHGKFWLDFALPYESGASVPKKDSGGGGGYTWHYSYTATLTACE